MMSDSTSSGRNDNHSHPTAHQASWVVDRNRRRALVTAARQCRIQPAVAPPGPAATATANAVLPGAPAAGQAVAGPGPGALHAAGSAVPGPAPPAANNAAPVAPVPGLIATGPTLAGVQGQNIPSGPVQGHANPPGAGQDQAAQPDDGDDAVGEQEEEQEQGDQPVVNDEDDTVEEQEDDQEQEQEQDDETNVIDEDDNGSEQGAQYEQDDQSGVEVGDNAVEEQGEEQERDNQPIGINNHAALVASAPTNTNDPENAGTQAQTNNAAPVNPLAPVFGPTISHAPTTAGTQGQINPLGPGQGQVNQPIVIDQDTAGDEQQPVLRVYNHEVTLVPGGYPDSTEFTLFDDQYRVTMADRARGTSSFPTFTLWFIATLTVFINTERYRDQQ